MVNRPGKDNKHLKEVSQVRPSFLILIKRDVFKTTERNHLEVHNLHRRDYLSCIQIAVVLSMLQIDKYFSDITIVALKNPLLNSLVNQQDGEPYT